MFRMVVLTFALVACTMGQFVDEKNAKILKEQRFNAGDGRAGSAFATENGVVFKEEADIDGNRIGQYSYVGDDGKTYTVRYSAGKDGFRILDGAHIPSGGQEAAAFNPELANPVEVVPEVRVEAIPEPAPLPVRRQQRPRPQVRVVQEPQPQPQQFVPQPINNNVILGGDERKENPFINPHDPTHRNFQFNKNALKFAPESPLAKQLSLIPDCAGCQGVNPFINPHDPTHNNGAILAGHLAGLGVPPQPRRAPAPIPRSRPAANIPRPTAAPVRARPLPLPVAPVEPQPTRQFPPGQLNLNRFETGFDFDFSS